MKTRRLHRVAGTTYGNRAAHIRSLLGNRPRRFVQCRLSHQPSNEHDAEAVAVIAREGGCEVGFLARGSLTPGRARQIDGDLARLEVGLCKAGAGVYGRVLVVATVQ